MLFDAEPDPDGLAAVVTVLFNKNGSGTV